MRDDRGRLLLVRRGVPPAKGLWSLPAGFVDADEDPRAAAAREALEETGLVVRVGDVVDVWAGGGGRASFFLAFSAEVVGGVLQAGDDAVDAGWFALDDLPELAFASTRAVAERLLPASAPAAHEAPSAQSASTAAATALAPRRQPTR